MTAGKNVHDTSSNRCKTAVFARCDHRGTEFMCKITRVTLLAFVYASGESVLPFWIFKRDSIPFRICAREGGSIFEEIILAILPGNPWQIKEKKLVVLTLIFS